jgi:glycosyltransferase involved in cell wall biosynthesis
MRTHRHASDDVRAEPREKRLLVISSHFPPERGAGVHRILRVVRQMSGVGWQVAVLTMDPASYRAGTPVDDALADRVPAGLPVYRTHVLRGLAAVSRWRRSVRQALTGIVHRLARPAGGHHRASSRGQRVETIRPARRPFIDAEIGWLWPAVRCGARIVARHQPEVVFSSAPPFTTHLIAGWLAKRYGLRWVADFRDPWARAPWGGAGLADSWKGRLRRLLEGMVVRQADAVILNTPLLRDEFAGHYGPGLAHKFHAVTNGYDAEVVGPHLSSSSPPSNRLVLTHAGSLYNKRDPRPLLRAVASALAKGRVAADRIEVHFVGAASAEFRLPETVQELELGQVVRLTPPVRHDQSLEYLAEADVLVVIQPGTHLQVPVKLYEYLPFRKPILALAPAGALGSIIEHAGLGLVVSPDDPAAIEEAICQLYEHRERLDERFRPDTDYIAQFDGAVVSRQMQNILENL